MQSVCFVIPKTWYRGSAYSHPSLAVIIAAGDGGALRNAEGFCLRRLAIRRISLPLTKHSLYWLYQSPGPLPLPAHGNRRTCTCNYSACPSLFPLRLRDFLSCPSLGFRKSWLPIRIQSLLQSPNGLLTLLGPPLLLHIVHIPSYPHVLEFHSYTLSPLSFFSSFSLSPSFSDHETSDPRRPLSLHLRSTHLILSATVSTDKKPITTS